MAHKDVDLTILGNHSRYPRLARFASRSPGPLAPPDGLDAIVGLVASDLIDTLPEAGPPVLHVTDATPAFLRDVYGWDVAPEADPRETRVYHRAAQTLYSSEAIAARAGRDLGLRSTRKLAVVPFGLNTSDMPSRLVSKPAMHPLELVFVGRDWQRKGGDIAVAALRHLRAGGCDARLTIVGPCPADLTGDPAIRCTGFLDQNRRSHRARLDRIYARAHLMILPTRADCTPMVVAEAMSRATPVIASDVGGMGTLVAPGTGRLLPLDASAAQWGEAILDMTRDPAAYDLMADAAFDRVQTRLNWTAWADTVIARVTVILEQGRSQPRTAA